MTDRAPAGDRIQGWYSRLETATDDTFIQAETWLRRSTRPLLIALVLATFVITAVACMVIVAVGTGRIGGAAPVASISPDQITETYGAEQFHLQLTAQANESP